MTIFNKEEKYCPPACEIVAMENSITFLDTSNDIDQWQDGTPDNPFYL